MTLDEQITGLKNALATGSKSVSMGDRTIVYRDLDEIQKILTGLQAEQDALNGGSSAPFGVIQLTYTKGL